MAPEQMALALEPLFLLVIAKVIAHWLVTGLPLVLMAPVLGIKFDRPADALLVMCVSLILGTPVLSLLGAVGAALTLGVRGGGVLVALLVLPPYVPALVFGSGAVVAAGAGLSAQAHLPSALRSRWPPCSPWAAAMALRISLD